MCAVRDFGCRMCAVRDVGSKDGLEDENNSVKKKTIDLVFVCLFCVQNARYLINCQ